MRKEGKERERATRRSKERRKRYAEEYREGRMCKNNIYPISSTQSLIPAPFPESFRGLHTFTLRKDFVKVVLVLSWAVLWAL